MISDVEFGQLQARDMLQHLLTGPISNSSADVVQGSRSVEVRAVGVTKVLSEYVADVKTFTYHMSNYIFFWSSISSCLQGAGIDRILGEIVHSKSIHTPIDYVLCVGHFLPKVSSLFYS